MKKFNSIIFSLLFLCFVNAQTIVKMSVPTQAQAPVNVVMLFDEQVPEGIPVVLGLMGYNVTGGMEPYTYQWFQNGNPIGTGDVVVITPQKGDQFSLKATDKNRCYNTTAFNMKVISRVGSNNEEANGFKIYPTIVNNDLIHIDLPKHDQLMTANIRVLDLKGDVIFQTVATGSYCINQNFVDGTYFVSVKTEAFHKVAKIIVQH